MNLLTIWIAIMIAYWWHFKRETPREREYREKQQQKSTQWNKYNMSNQSGQSSMSSKPKHTEKSDWDKHNMDSFK